MLYCDLLRVTVLLVGAVATALGVIAMIAANRDADTLALAVAAGWWLLAAAAGLFLGSPERGAEAMRNALTSAKTATSLPSESPVRIALARLWPIGAFALGAGAAGAIWPQVAVVGAGYAILIALIWRGREGAVAAIEERDGVRFYVERTPAWQPVKITRTPGLYRDRAPRAKPPPPPPARVG